MGDIFDQVAKGSPPPAEDIFQQVQFQNRTQAYAGQMAEMFTRIEELQHDSEARQQYVRKYWREQGQALAKSDVKFMGEPDLASIHLLRTTPKEVMDKVQERRVIEWQKVAKNRAVGEFFKKRQQMANALWNQVHLRDPEISDQDAYKHMHQRLADYGYQPPGAGALPPLVMREGQWENEYVQGWTEFRSGVRGVAKGMYKLIHTAPKLHVMAGEAVHDWMHQDVMGAEVHGTNTYRDARHRMAIDRRYFDQYVDRGIGEIPYLPPGFDIFEIIGEQIPQFTMMAGAGQAVAAGLISKFVGRTATAASMFALETTDAYDQYMHYAVEKNGMDPRVASQIAAGGAVLYGVVAGVLETFGPFELMARQTPKTFRRVARMGIFSLAEGGTELLQALAQFKGAELLGLKELDWGQVKKALNEGVAGMIFGGLAGAGRISGQNEGQGRTAKPPQLAGPGMNIDPGDMGPAVDIPETVQRAIEEAPSAEEVDLTPEAALPTLSPEQVVDQMIEMTPEAERTDVTRVAFEANLDTLRHGQESFVEVEVPLKALEIMGVTIEEAGPKAQEYLDLDTVPPPIVAGSMEGMAQLSVVDGVHRVYAAQLRGDTTIRALIPQTDAATITAPAVIPEADIERRAGEPTVLSTAEFIEQQRVARQEWGETPEQIDEALRQDAQRMLDRAEEFGGTVEEIATRKQRAQEVIDELGRPTTEAPSVVTREGEADVETKLVKKSISLVQKKLGREGSKITDSKSLAEVGMAIAEIVGLDPEIDITWQFKTDPELVGVAGLHQKLRDGTHKITIRSGTEYKKGAIITPAIAKRKTQAGVKAGQVTPSKTNIYRIVVHELGHIAKPPIRGEAPISPRKLHHDEFVKWVEEGVRKLIGTTYVEAPAVDPLVSPYNVPMAEDAKSVPGQPEGEAPQTLGSVIKTLFADEGGYLDTAALGNAVAGGINAGTEDIGSTWRGFKALTDESAPMRRTDAGLRIMEVMDAAQSKAQAKIGEHNSKFLGAYDQLTTDEKRWLETFRDDGWTNWATLREHPDRLDAATVPQAAITLSQVSAGQQTDSAQGAINARLPQTRTEIVIGPQRGKTYKRVVGIFKPAKGGRYYRIMTPEGRSAIDNQAGPVFDALLAHHEAYPERNPDLPITAEELKKVLHGVQQSGKTKQTGSLEHTRVFKELPQAVNVKGKWVPIMECRPVNHFMASNESQWRRIAFWDVVQDRLLGPGRYQFGEYNEETGEYELSHPDNKELTDVDGLVDRLRTVLVKEEATRKHGRPEGIKRTFKRVLDNYFRQFQGGVMEEVFMGGDHHNRIVQGIGIVDRNQMSSILSFSGLWDLLQSTVSTHIVGVQNLLEAHAKVLLDPKKYAAEYQAIGAVMLRHHDYMLRKTRRELTGGVLERGVPQVLMTGAEISEKWAQTVTATAYDIWSERINGNLKDRQARELRIDLRLTDAEILEVAQGKMSDATKAKIIQNGVKTTNFLAEDPMHRGVLQNNGLLRRMVPFTSVVSGSWRAADRIVAHIKEDVGRIKRGDKEATKDLIKNLGGMLTFIVGCYGRGFVQNMLRRLITGRPLLRPEEEDDWAGTLLESLGEGAIFGPYWRLFEAAKYSGGDPSRMAVNMLPRVAIWLETLSALGGWGKYEGTAWGKRMARRGYEISPAARSVRGWHDRLVHPGRVEYQEVRSRVRLFLEEEGEVPKRGYGPTNRYYYAVFEAVRDQNDVALEKAIAGYKEWAKTEGRTSEEARTALRSALHARRPMNLREERIKKFLAGLTEAQRTMAEQQQREYMTWIDRATGQPGRRKRKIKKKRQKKQRGGDWYGTD